MLKLAVLLLSISTVVAWTWKPITSAKMTGQTANKIRLTLPLSAVKVTEQTGNKISSFYAGPSDWTIDSWKAYPIKQPPKYPDSAEVDRVVDKLEKCSPLVFAGEARTLQESLAKVSEGEGFLLMVY